MIMILHLYGAVLSLPTGRILGIPSETWQLAVAQGWRLMTLSAFLK